VHSETGSHSYNVYFRAPQDNEIPSCECIDWQKNYLPCKHILAVIQNKKYDNWKWENLPTEYRESPFYTLDIDILFKPIDRTLDKVYKNQQDCSMQTGAQNLERTTEEVTSIETMTAELPKPAFPKRTAVTRCCDLLSRIKNLVYECTNSTSLSNLEKTLLTAFKELEDNSNTDEGLTLTAPDTSVSSTKRKKRKSSKSDNQLKKKIKIVQAKICSGKEEASF
jgi:hypothetical protein